MRPRTMAVLGAAALTADVSAYAGQTVRILVDAADAGSGSLVEAAPNNLKITM